jgi:hypothetical protein
LATTRTAMPRSVMTTTKRSSFRTEAAFESSLPGRQVARLCSSFHQVASLFSCLSSPPCSRSLRRNPGTPLLWQLRPLANGTRIDSGPKSWLATKVTPAHCDAIGQFVYPSLGASLERNPVRPDVPPHAGVYRKPPSTIREALYRLWLIRFAQSRLGENPRQNEVGGGVAPG